MIAQPTLTKTQKYCLTFILALTLTLAWTTIVRADGPGDLDITFGGTGVVTTSISSGNDGGQSVAIQPDGKIVVAGSSDSKVFAVVRYNGDGSLDTGFNSTGMVTTSFGSPALGHDLAVQPDGKIVVAGFFNDGLFGNDFAVARYESNGDPDTSFGFLGAMVTSIGSRSDVGWGVALQSDGKIVVAGETEVGMSGLEYDIAVVRYTVTGTLDTEFDSTGIVTTRIASGFNSGINVAVQPDDKIVVVGGSNNNLAVVRYTITGTLDTSFNGTGVVTTPIGANVLGLAVTLQPDGKIVVAGFNNDDFLVARYNSDGSLDTSFNTFGFVITPITGNIDFGNDLVIQPNGKIVVAGTSGWISGNDGNIAVVRYNSDGSLDTTFGIVTTFINTASSGNGIALQPDGKIVVAGNSSSVGTKFDFTVVRYLGDVTELSLTKTVDNETPEPGQVITYTLAISNSGTVTATNALISDTLPTDLTLAGPVMLDPPGAGTIGTLPTLVSGLSITPGKSITVTFPVTVSAGLSAGIHLTNTASITSPEISTLVTDTAVITIAMVPVYVPPPALTKTVNNTTPTPGQLITYTLSISNSGSFSTTNLLISDTLPLSLTLAGGVALTPTQPGAILATSALSLPTVASSVTISPMTSITVTIPVTVGAGLSSGLHLTNTATISSPEMSSPVTDTVVITIATVPVDVPPPTLSKTVDDNTPDPGQLITYTLSISNSGSFTTTNLLISDTLPLSLTLAGGVALTPTQPGAILATSALSLPTVASSVTISPFTSITVTIPVTVGVGLTEGLHLTNTATISSPEMSSPVTDTVVVTIATIPVDVPPPTLTKTANNTTPTPGQLITYTLSISNSGSFSTTNLLISDTLPLSLTLAGDVALTPTQSGAILATSALSLPTVADSVTISPMTSITVTIPVTVGAELSPGMHLTNTATISSPDMSSPVTDTVVITIVAIVVDPGFDLYLPVILKN